MKKITILSLALIFALFACKNWQVEHLEAFRIEDPNAPQQKTSIKPTYEVVKNDPSGTQIYRLTNGLTLYLSPNPTAPRIQTLISVNAGSVHDPADATGLAHYLEHMLFKGTDKIGTINYEKERVYIDQIADLFESLRNTQDTIKRQTIYTQIDSISQLAGKFAAPNELSQLYQSIGAKKTNAFTGSEYTAYINDIPSNQLENWLVIEQERFNKPVLRLFHTELEAVYEEKNMGLDNPDRQMYYAMMEALFPTHNYGQQTTIGTVEHLKSPSMKAIHNYFYAHYVPNNMAVHLAGDFNPDEAVQLIDKYFGSWQANTPPEYAPETEKPMETKTIVELTSTEAPKLSIAYRFNNVRKKDKYLAIMVDMLLSNSKAGLIDVNINQPKKAIGAYSYHYPMKDYTLHVMGGQPTKGQSLEELEALIMEQIELIKKGEFPDWLPQAVVKNLKMDELESLRSNRSRIYNSLDAFSKNMSWQEKVAYFDLLAAIKKEDIVAFAQKNYHENCVVVYRNQVAETPRLAIPKPPITPISGNENNQSDFAKAFYQRGTSKEISPDTTRADELIFTTQLKNDTELIYRKNSRDELFDFKVYFPTGDYQSKTLAYALDLMKRSGTDSLSARAINEAWYQMGVEFNLGTGDNHTVIQFKGLKQQLPKAISLFQHQLNHFNIDKDIWEAIVQSQLQARDNMMASKKDLMWTGMKDLLIYGKQSPLQFQLSNEELLLLKTEDLKTELIQTLTTPYRYTYYGENEVETITEWITHYFNANEKVSKTDFNFARKNTLENEIFFINQNTQQAEILLLANGAVMDNKDWAVHELFNEYFGGSMSSIVFQEMREKQALAYSVYAGYSAPKKQNDPRYVIAYIGTQADKYQEAMNGMLDLLNNLIIDSVKFEQSKRAILQAIESDRIPEYSAINRYLTALESGTPLNKNHLVYSTVNDLTISDIQTYFDQHIKGKRFRIGIVGPESEIDLNSLTKHGKVVVLKRSDLFPF